MFFKWMQLTENKYRNENLIKKLNCLNLMCGNIFVSN